ncbi:hypothetical protein BDU57DRAFT_512804 [Ampelomyces quisqualis]|uniref:Transmembrane protein n=1 Tax=Ampelomyces quisqualis TaxID=50730 RepID=A0A6A5QYG4_AMPQU|nr:hypothetical protein BDU57DRAFT_512804 [Ampelomyces quisqualis]
MVHNPNPSTSNHNPAQNPTATSVDHYPTQKHALLLFSCAGGLLSAVSITMHVLRAVHACTKGVRSWVGCGVDKRSAAGRVTRNPSIHPSINQRLSQNTQCSDIWS